MMARTVLTVCFAAALAVFATACSPASQTIQPPRVDLTGVVVLPGAGSNQRFRVSLLLTNPNAEPLPVERVRFSVRLAGEGLLNGNSTNLLTLPAAGQETLSIDVDGDLISSVSRLLALVQGPQSTLPYELIGDLTLNRRALDSVPFNSSGQVPLATSAAR